MPRPIRTAVVLAAWMASGLPAAAGGQEHGSPTAEGLWQGAILYEPGVLEADIVVELAQAPDGRWVGTIDVLSIGLEFQPLDDISVDGAEVTFWFRRTSPTRGPVVSPFQGRLSADGTTMQGDFLDGGQDRLAFVLKRIAEAGEPRPEPRPAALHALSPGAEELREAFNRHPDAVRVVMLLSPT